MQVVNAGDSEFKAGEIIETGDSVEELNEELKRRKVVVRAVLLLSLRMGRRQVRGRAGQRLARRTLKNHHRTGQLPAGRQLRAEEPRGSGLRRRVAEAAGLVVAASLIPFLENDDANRALMGSNMQRQAVPLIRGEAPLVGTGMERVTARDSGAVVLCQRDGIVDQVDSERIIVRVESDHSGVLSREVGADIYHADQVQAFEPEHLHQPEAAGSRGRPREQKSQVLADGPCTDRGELALGRNVLVAFLPVARLQL